jgi:SAM-dependent methyltransferase
MDNTQRFSNRVDNYVKYRPGYPKQILEQLREETGLAPDWVVADIGSGTGISTALFLENGHKMFAVEPNRAMREMAEELLKDGQARREEEKGAERWGELESIDGTAEQTGLASGSIDLVTASQAFHWFDREAARKEFVRILRPPGWVALIWNDRMVENEFEKDYEVFLLQYAIDYRQVNHRNISDEAIQAFFSPLPCRLRTADNEQIFDLDGLKGRVLSSSYMPADDSHPRYHAMIGALEGVFAKYENDGRVRVRYRTKMYVGKLKQ